MNAAEDGASVERPALDRLAAPRRTAGRVARLSLKELRESLRDRRTIITLVLMPLLVYPLLSIVFQRFLLSSMQRPGAVSYVLVFGSQEAQRTFVRYLRAGNALVERARQNGAGTRGTDSTPALRGKNVPGTEPALEYFVHSDVTAHLADMSADLGVRMTKRSGSRRGNGWPPVDFELFSLEGSRGGAQVLEYVEERLDAVNDEYLLSRLDRIGVSRQSLPVRLSTKSVQGERTETPFSLASVIPLILILMTITGAVYPAIDLTAGERERGTLETLIAAPVPRMGLLLAKYVAVLTVALLTASVNLLAMTVTILSVGLSEVLFGSDGLSLATVVQVFGLTVLFAAFFSGVLLAVTSFARSFKEAQAYLIPLMLLSLAPGMLALMPGLELGGLLTVLPLVNVVLLARDLFLGSAQPLVGLFVVISTIVYTFGALAVASRIFGTDAILYGSEGRWSDFFRRPDRPDQTATLSGALLCLGAVFPAYVLLGSAVGRMQDTPLAVRLGLTSLLTMLLFGGLPGAVALFGHIEFSSGFRLRPARRLSFLGAVLLGVSAWPVAFELVMLARQAGVATFDTSFFERIEMLLKEWNQVPFLGILLALAVVPALFEEFFFRGFLQSAFSRRMRAPAAIVLSGVLFGVFHLIATDVLAVERLLPSTLLGILLGWVCQRSGSIFPGILLHACHNGLLLTIAHSRSELARLGWNVEISQHLPAAWLAGSACGLLAGVLLVHRGTR